MEVTYELTQRDFFESFMAHYRSRKLLKWVYRVLITLIVIFGILSLIGASIRHSVNVLSTLFEFLALAGLWCLFWWGSPWWLARTQFQKQPSARGQRTISYEREGIRVRWDGGSGEVEWKNYVRWMETRNQIVLYTSPLMFGIVPKRALNPEQLSELRALLTQNIGEGLRV